MYEQYRWTLLESSFAAIEMFRFECQVEADLCFCSPRWSHILLSFPRSSSAATLPISPFEGRKERIYGAGRLALGDELI